MLNFHNGGGIFRTHALRLAFDCDRFRIRAMDVQTRETTEDAGWCDLYLDCGCRRIFAPEWDFESDHYDFGLEPRADGRYLYVETWADGYSARTEVDCRPAAQRPGNGS